MQVPTHVCTVGLNEDVTKRVADAARMSEADAARTSEDAAILEIISPTITGEGAKMVQEGQVDVCVCVMCVLVCVCCAFALCVVTCACVCACVCVCMCVMSCGHV